MDQSCACYRGRALVCSFLALQVLGPLESLRANNFNRVQKIATARIFHVTKYSDGPRLLIAPLGMLLIKQRKQLICGSWVGGCRSGVEQPQCGGLAGL